MKTRGRAWIVAGALLDVAGAALIVTSLPEAGSRLAAGIAALIAGSLAVFHGVIQLSHSVQRPAAVSAERQLAAWKPEPELAAPPPRPVRLSRTGKLTAVMWTLMIVTVPALLYFGSPELAPPDQLLSEHGVGATATIHRKATRPAAGGEPAYYLYYHFDDHLGNGFRASERVSKRVYESLQVNDELQVVYLADDPLAHSVVGISDSQDAPWLRPLSLIFLCVVLVVLDGQRRRHKRLTTHGLPAPGMVESLTRRGATKRFKVKYTVEGEEWTLRGSERHSALQEGEVLTVLYQQGRPGRAILYRLSLYRAAGPGL